ncbi:MAG: CocE/NonD family hydrolase [Pseudomonadota bacterium]
MTLIIRCSTVLLMLFLTMTASFAQVSELRDAGTFLEERWQGYTYQEVMVPMRDGTKLRTHILRPKNADGPLPIILTRSPYGFRLPERHLTGQGDLFFEWRFHTPLLKDGYIFIGQDERGRYGSEGKFEMLRPFRSADDSNAVDDVTDTYDTIEWALANVEDNNGRVALHGNSYPGWHVIAGLVDPHPAVKAATPSAAMSEGFIGDDFYHNGAFQLGYIVPFLTQYMDQYDKKDLANPFTTGVKGIDGYDFYLNNGTIKQLRQYFPDPAPLTEEIIANDRFNDFYKSREVRRFIRRPVTVPTLHINHFYDAEDHYGPLAFYHEMEAFDKDNLNHIVAGPWFHGAWRFDDGEKFGPISFGSKTGVFFMEEVMLPFYRHHLKGDKKPDLPEALIFDAGKNKWNRFDTWPLPKARKMTLYLHDEGKASFKKPGKVSSDTAYDAYTADPANPVPYYPRPNFGGWQKDYKVQDQRFALNRSDVLTYSTAPLKSDLTLCGEARAKLFASSEGTDTDWVVKVIDRYPDDDKNQTLRGFQRMVFSDIFRAKFRESYAEPKPLEPGKVLAYDIPLLEQCHTIRKGHQLMVHVQSSWFPLFDRNPNKFMSIPDADPEDYVAVENRIYRSADYPSSIELSVIK